MDLQQCPRCGEDWAGGDSCPKCKFVPIGSELWKSQRKKKKAGKYVEPGSSRGCLSVIFLGLLSYGAFRYQPWQDDWEMVRALFGQGRHHSLVGDWEVVKTLAVANEQGIMARDSVQKGSMTFSEKGNVKLSFLHPESETSASGKYLVSGTQVALLELRTSGDTSEEIPPSLNMNLAWTGKDDVIVMDKTEAIYLHRRKTNNALTTFMQMGLHKEETPETGKGPTEGRGVIGEIKRSAQDTEDMANSN